MYLYMFYFVYYIILTVFIILGSSLNYFLVF